MSDIGLYAKTDMGDGFQDNFAEKLTPTSGMANGEGSHNSPLIILDGMIFNGGTRDGMVWFGTHLGVWLYDPSSDVYTCITTSLSERQTAVGVRCLMEDSHGDIWIGTWDMGLFRYERSTGQIVDYPQINARNSVTSLCEDDQHRLWVGSWQCGIQVIEQPWDREHYRVTTFDKQIYSNHSSSLCEHPFPGQTFGTVGWKACCAACL